MSRRPRRNHSAIFKAKVALDAIKAERTLAELAKAHDGSVRISVCEALRLFHGGGRHESAE